MRSGGNQGLFFLVFPKGELFGSSLRESWKMFSALFHVGVILGSVQFISSEIVNSDVLINIAGSSVAIVTVSKLAGLSRINLFNFVVPFYLIAVRSRVVFSKFSGE